MTITGTAIVLRGNDIEHFAFLDQRADPEDLRAFGDAGAEPLDDAGILGDREHGGVDGLSAAWLLLQH